LPAVKTNVVAVSINSIDRSFDLEAFIIKTKKALRNGGLFNIIT
jgi:hypothetical protein